MTSWLAVLFCLILQAPQSPPKKVGPVPTPKGKMATPQELAELSLRLRKFALAHVPSPLYEASPNWGETTMAREKLLKKDSKLVPKNHGNWRKIKVTADDLPQTLVFQVTRFERVTPKMVSVDLFVSLDTRVQVVQQTWRKGLKLLDGEIRARMKAKVILCCDVYMEIKPTKYIVPEIIFRLKVRRADVDYENLVTEHIFGLGGEGAKALGELIIDILREVKPSLKQKLLERLEGSIVKALDNKEVKINVGKLFDKK